MGIPLSRLNLTGAPFHGIIPRREDKPLSQITLPVTFRDRGNYKTESFLFYVVDFLGSYHAILGRSCYAKLMAAPIYVYIKLKVPGPNGAIPVHGNFHKAYMCGSKSVQMAAAFVTPTLRGNTTQETFPDELPKKA